ncbi:piwi-like protein 1, partial [Plakobranchus ocellatus]
MSEPGQGRARGRGGRGRSRPQTAEQVVPGQAPAPSQPPPPGAAGAGQSAPPVGRGRARGMAARQAAAQQQQQQQVSQVQQQQAQAEAGGAMVGGRGVQRGGGRERPSGNGNGGPPTAQMAGMSLGERGDAPYTRRAPYEKYVERQWKDAAISSKGVKGDKCTLITNYFEVTLPSEFRIFQYHVDFKPAIENVRVKFAMIAALSDIIGETKCFDGGILYLCRKLQPD